MVVGGGWVGQAITNPISGPSFDFTFTIGPELDKKLSFLSLNAKAPSENPDQSLDMNKSHDVGPKPSLTRIQILTWTEAGRLRDHHCKCIFSHFLSSLYSSNANVG